MNGALSWLWLVALLGFSVCGISLQQRMASLAALMRDLRPDLRSRIERNRGGGWSILALVRWLLWGDWKNVPETLIQAYAQTCLRLLRLSIAWLVALVAAITLLR